MAMGSTVPRSDEIAVWREATTMIGLTGPGGCAKFRDEAERILEIRKERLTAEGLTAAVRDGGRVILLIDQCHTHDHHAPH